MKKIIISLILLSFIFAIIAKAVVIAPPVIYMVTFSMGSFILNLFIITAAYMAAKGMINRFYFGRKMHEIIGIMFLCTGNLLLILFAAVISILLFDPIDEKSLFYAGTFASIISFLIYLLANYRIYSISVNGSGYNIIMRALKFAIIVFIATFVSAYYSINTNVVMKQIQPERADQVEKRAYDFKNIDMPREGNYERKIEGVQDSSNRTARTNLWFVPYKSGKCEIMVNDISVKNIDAAGKCFYYDKNGNTIRVICPIAFSAEEIFQSDRFRDGSFVKIESSGSCAEVYNVKITKKGFMDVLK